jgi:cytochrome c-type biogenesis protein CcmH
MAGSGSKPIVARPIAWIGILAAVVALLAVSVLDQGGAETDSERIQRLSESFACPQCSGESVADSNAAVSATIRQFIADEVTAGSTDVEIRDQLVRNYGAAVLLNPPADGFAALVWILPVIVLVFAAMGAGAALSRAGPKADRQATADDLALVDRARQMVDPVGEVSRSRPETGEAGDGVDR